MGTFIIIITMLCFTFCNASQKVHHPGKSFHEEIAKGNVKITLIPSYVYLQNEKYENALQIAISNKKNEIVKQILYFEKQFDIPRKEKTLIYANDINGNNALQKSILSKNDHALDAILIHESTLGSGNKNLIYNRNDDGANALQVAILDGNFKLVQALVQYERKIEPSIEDRIQIYQKNNQGMNALQTSILKFNPKIIKYLLNYEESLIKPGNSKIQIYQTDKNGDNSLKLAIRKKKFEVVKILLDHEIAIDNRANDLIHDGAQSVYDLVEEKYPELISLMSNHTGRKDDGRMSTEPQARKIQTVQSHARGIETIELFSTTTEDPLQEVMKTPFLSMIWAIENDDDEILELILDKLKEAQDVKSGNVPSNTNVITNEDIMKWNILISQKNLQNTKISQILHDHEETWMKLFYK